MEANPDQQVEKVPFEALAIKNYILAHRDSDSIDAGQIEGVSKIEKIKTPKGNDVYVVRLEKERHTVIPFVGVGPGYSIPAKGPDDINIVFVCEGYSPDAEKAIINHEFYHIDHSGWATKLMRKYPYLNPVFGAAHEVETYVNDLKTNPLATIKLLAVQYPGMIAGGIRRRVSRVLSRSSDRPPKE
ncbi:MAG: hypothetical protein WC604_02110 [Candidatus Gracilibacteria bacterium]